MTKVENFQIKKKSNTQVGPRGPRGFTGAQGKQGLTGEPGPQGVRGIIGPKGLNGLNGKDGKDGSKWWAGKGKPDASVGKVGDFYLDELTADIYWRKSTGWEWQLNIKGPKGERGPGGGAGSDGAPGPAGEKGDKGDPGDIGPEGPAGSPGSPGVGVPTGGTTGQILAKDTDTDYDTEWIDPPSGGGVAIGDTIGNSPVADGLLYSDAGALANDRLAATTGMFFGAVPYTQVTASNVANTSLNYIDAAGFGVGQGYFIGLPDTASIFQIGRLSDFSAYFRIIYGGSGTPQATLNATLTIGGTDNVPNLVNFADNDNDYEYFIGRIDNTHSITGRDTFAFHVDTAKSFGWYSSSYTKLMELTGGTGLLYLPSIQSDGTAPTTSGDTKMVIVDENGMLSFDDIPTPGSTLDLEVDGTPNGDQTLLNLVSGTGITLTDDGMGSVTIDSSGGGTPAGSDSEVQFNDSGAFGSSANFVYDDTNFVTKMYRNDNTQTTSILSIRDDSNREIVGFATPNASSITQFRVGAPNSGNHAINFRSSAPDQDWNVEIGNGLVFWYSTSDGNVPFAMTPSAFVYLGPWNFATTLGQVNVYNDEPTRASLAVRAAASQSGDIQTWHNNSNTKLAAITKNGGFRAAVMSDSAAVNGTVYESTDNGKLSYKDSGGVVNPLY